MISLVSSIFQAFPSPAARHFSVNFIGKAGPAAETAAGENACAHSRALAFTLLTDGTWLVRAQRTSSFSALP